MDAAEPSMKVYVSGAAMTVFRRSPMSLNRLACDSAARALADAGLDMTDLDLVVYANAVSGLLQGQEMIRGQVALRELNTAGLPILNVENACASGSSAVAIASMAIRSGTARRVLVVGAEKLAVTEKAATFAAIGAARDMSVARSGDDPAHSPFMDIYAGEAKEYMKRSGATVGDLAGVSVKNRAHGALNPNAQFREKVTLAEVLASRVIVEPLHLLMCSPISDGGSALVLSSDAPADAPVIRLRASALASGTDRGTSGLESVSTRAAVAAYEAAGVGPDEVDVVEVHDAVACAELYAYEELQLARPDEGVELLRSGASALGGRVPVNPSGGLLARGHPIGATGCAQLVELVGQLRGASGARQVEDARVALSHNVGGWLGEDGAVACVTLLTRESRS